MKPAELRLVFVSDIHLSFDNLRKISEFAGSSNLKFDYCLVGGDIANCQPDDSPQTKQMMLLQAKSVLRMLLKACSCKVLFIPGNHDPEIFFQRGNNAGLESEIINLHSQRMSLAEGISIFGFGGSIPAYLDLQDPSTKVWEGFPFVNQEDFRQAFESALEQCTKNHPGDQKIINFTHIGPASSSTTIDRRKLQSPIFAGSKRLDLMLADENVLLSLHGHVHAGGKLDMYMQNNIEQTRRISQTVGHYVSGNSPTCALPMQELVGNCLRLFMRNYFDRQCLPIHDPQSCDIAISDMIQTMRSTLRNLIGLSLKNSLRWQFSASVERVQQILNKIQVESDGKTVNIIDSKIIVSHEVNSETNKVKLLLNLTKDYRQIKALLISALESEGFKDVEITLAPKSKQQKYARKGNLSNIKRVIAVSSCKGGVGKSTIAINLAAQLSNQGHKVGIFDSDIYGPSLPTLIGQQSARLEAREENPKQIEPIIYEGIRCMSFGFVGSKNAVMRGPMVSSVLSQLLHQTHWGQLDYLIVDMPPGTGDIQLSLCQQLRFDGAVIVTTPQRLAFIDVIKGIQMFQDLRVRIVGVVENMSYYECSHCHSHDLIFGRGYTNMLMDQFGIQNTFQFPLFSDISLYSDEGTPIAFVLPPQHKLSLLYNKLAKSVHSELAKELERTLVYYDTNSRKIVIEQKGVKKTLDPYTLRGLCRCASCVDELTGAMLIRKQEIDPEVYPIRVEEKGNYAVAVVWSDGHRSSIYPYKRLMSQKIPSA